MECGALCGDCVGGDRHHHDRCRPVSVGIVISVKAKAKKLVTRGLYSKIRNPIYVFGMVMIVGLALVVQLPALWVIAAIIFIAQVVRARREAAVLEAAFGEEYREYRRKTWF